MDTGDRTCAAEVVLPCEDIAESVEFYTDEPGAQWCQAPRRGGMQCRNLLPERGGGRFVVSHIGVPGSGPVHDTFGGHDTVLGSGSVRSGRIYGGQRFSHHRAAAAEIALDHTAEPFLAIILLGGAVLDCGQTRKVFVGDAFSVPERGVARLNRCADQRGVLLVRLPDRQQVSPPT